jgi:hypothetical protein
VLGTNGQLVRYQVRLENIRSAISGAAFTLSYPTAALRLASSQPYRVGWMVPGNALPVWNASAPGQLRLAVSSDSAWLNSAGVLAEVTFEVLPGASSRYAWPIGLASVEVTPNGYAPRPLPTAGAQLTTRPAAGGNLSAPHRGASGQFIFSLIGDAGATYELQASTDLVHWEMISTLQNITGTLEISDPNAATLSHRFYRARPVD